MSGPPQERGELSPRQQRSAARAFQSGDELRAKKRAGKAGIGLRCDIAIALHLGDELEPRFRLDGNPHRANPAWWAYEGRNIRHPREMLSPKGSDNHELAAMVLELLSGRG